jgi:hypothetical protein
LTERTQFCGAFRIEGTVELNFDGSDRQPIVPALVQTWLSKLGDYLGNGRRLGAACEDVNARR